MPEVSLSETLGNEQFTNLPLDQQLKVLRENNKAFSSLSPKDQGTVLYKAKSAFRPDYAKSAEGQKDLGFFGALGTDLKSLFQLPGSLALDPGGTVGGMVKSQVEPFSKAAEEFEQPGIGHKISGAGYTAAGLLPAVGPIAASAGESIGEGRYGEGGARALEALAPFAGKGAREVIKSRAPEPELTPREIAGKSPLPGPPSLMERIKTAPISEIGGTVAGMGAGSLAGHPYVGGYIGREIARNLFNKPVEEVPKVNPNIARKYAKTESSGPTGPKPQTSGPTKYNPPDISEKPVELFRVNPRIKQKYSRTESSGPTGPKSRAKPTKYNPPKLGPEADPRVNALEGEESKPEKPFGSEKGSITLNKRVEPFKSETTEEPLSYTREREQYERQNFPPEERTAKKPLSEKEVESFHAEPRTAKANRYREKLKSSGITKEDATKMSKEAWRSAAKSFNEYEPSEKTIVEILRGWKE